MLLINSIVLFPDNLACLPKSCHSFCPFNKTIKAEIDIRKCYRIKTSTTGSIPRSPQDAMLKTLPDSVYVPMKWVDRFERLKAPKGAMLTCSTKLVRKHFRQMTIWSISLQLIPSQASFCSSKPTTYKPLVLPE